jgi:hypothetical protein
VWTAIQASALASQTVLVAVSDHGMNTQPGVYSQGYNLLNFFNSRAGGAHHVATNRHPLDEFKLSGLNPFVSEVVTPSDESLYLKGEANDYPTVLLDPDGNERASVYLRNSAFNMLHILLKEINRPGTSAPIRHAAITAFMHVIDEHRVDWQLTLQQLSEELDAVRRAMARQRTQVESEPKKWTQEQRDAGLDKAARRLAVQLDSWRDEERTYSIYTRALSRLLTLEPDDFNRHRLSVEELIPKRAMGDHNSVQDLENYIVGPSAGGLVLAPDGSLDFARSFERINYPPLLASLSVRNNVQASLGSHPVDFVAIPSGDSIWLYASEDKQALISSRGDELRYTPLHGTKPAAFVPGLPLRLFEDENLSVPESEREAWFNAWHSESDWFHATHQTAYSNGIIALHEQFLPPILAHSSDPDSALLARFNQRRRRLAEPDFIIFANDHWNFNVRNFNPGGNHGSFLRASTHAILLFAGGADTGVPHHQEIQEPYDSLSFVPTILDLMGMHADAARLPGHAIQEVLPANGPAVTASSRE